MQTDQKTIDAPVPEGKSLLLFDGVCNLCNGFVQFLIKRDPDARFVFASLQSELGQSILKQIGLPTRELKSVILVRNDRVYTRSDVPLQVSRHMKGLWPLLYAFVIIPGPLRDAIYDWIARNRYHWFGKKEQCMIPTPELKERFLD